MSTEIAPAMSFEDKLKSKIKDGIGDLITDNDLSKLVHRSLEEIFFTPRKNPKKDYYNSREPDTLPPLLHVLVREALQPMVKEVIEAYVKEHNNEVLNIVNRVVKEGVGNAVITAMNSQFQNQLLNFQVNIQNQLTQK